MARSLFAVASLAAILVTLWITPSEAQLFGGGGFRNAGADGAVFGTAVISLIAGLLIGGLLVGWRRLMESPQAGAAIAGICGLALFIAIGVGEGSRDGTTIGLAGLAASVLAFGLGLGIALHFLASPVGRIPNLWSAPTEVVHPLG